MNNPLMHTHYLAHGSRFKPKSHDWVGMLATASKHPVHTHHRVRHGIAIDNGLGIVR